MLQIGCAAGVSILICVSSLIRLIYHLRQTLLQFTSEWFRGDRDCEAIIRSRHTFVTRSFTLFRAVQILSEFALISSGLRLPEVRDLLLAGFLQSLL